MTKSFVRPRGASRIAGRQLLGRAPKKVFDWRLLFLGAYLFTLVFEGPVRMALTLLNIETLLYTRDLVALGTILWVSFKGYPDKNRFNVSALVFFLILCHAILSWWIGHPIASVLFGFKIFISFMFGVACSDLLLENERWVVRLAVFFLGMSAIGVFLNVVVGTYPWEGGEFESVLGVSKNSNIWWSGGERRLAGFARMSFSAAVIIGMCGVFVMAYVESYFLKIAAAALALPAIYITTSKGVILSFLFAGMVGFLPKGWFRQRMTFWLIGFFALSAAVLPLWMSVVQLNPNLMRFVPSMLSSFVDRAAVTWPGALADLSNWYNVLVGQGVGGIGGSLRYGSEFYRYNPIDNLFLYFYWTYGIFGVAYYAASVLQIFRIPQSERYGSALLAVGVLVFGYGVTAHQFEDAFVGIVFGLLVGAVPWAAGAWRSVRKEGLQEAKAVTV
jgi:hypothetical protein